MGESVSFVKAVQLFFSADPYGRKVEIGEFKALPRPDREEIRVMLIAEGFDVQELPQSTHPAT